MNITNRFNRYYHGVVLKQVFDNCPILIFKDWYVDNEFLKLEREFHYRGLDELKDWLKKLNINYEIDKDKKISTSKIQSKALTQHIDFICKTTAESGVELPFIKEDWERILNSY